MFSADGALLYATGELDADTTLATLGADALKSDAIAAGTATGRSAIGALTLTKLGSGSTTVLLASLPDGADGSADAVRTPSRTSDRCKLAGDDRCVRANRRERRTPSAGTPADNPARAERPLRFVWTMDARRALQPCRAPSSPTRWGRAPRDVLGQPWSEIAVGARRSMPEGRVAKAVASRDTWSGVTIAWPSERPAKP